ncbi:hypothetical protein KQI63_02130 [bacterium]|nr:hypothetical protein [bacterium]
MYRLELDLERKIAVLVISGTQDGWEAKLMKMEWENRQDTVDSSWSLIFDIEGYIRAQGDAVKYQKEFAPVLAAAKLQHKLFLPPNGKIDASPLIQGAGLTEANSFVDAWKQCGGEDRTVRLAPPADGTRYTANNKPSQVQ